MPTKNLYLNALAIVWPDLPAIHKELLRVHYASPGRSTSTTVLARAVGYRNCQGVNLNYGIVAAKIGKRVGVPPDPSRDNLWAIATWEHGHRDRAGHFVFTMRPELAAALRQAGLVGGARAPTEAYLPDDGFEGMKRLRLVRHITREGRLRAAKIRDALGATGDAALKCAVPGCSFDFSSRYGSLGAGFAEVHHLRPLAKGAVFGGRA